MRSNGKTQAAVEDRVTGNGNGSSRLSPQDVERLFGDGYREIEILPDGTLRERTGGGDPVDARVTRTLKTERTWY
jgi:hypothetical protein